MVSSFSIFTVFTRGFIHLILASFLSLTILFIALARGLEFLIGTINPSTTALEQCSLLVVITGFPIAMGSAKPLGQPPYL